MNEAPGIKSIVEVQWESGEWDTDLFVVVDVRDGKVAIKSLTEVNPITHYVLPSQLRPGHST